MVDSVDARPSPQLTREKRTGTTSLGTSAPICDPDAVMWNTSRSAGSRRARLPLWVLLPRVSMIARPVSRMRGKIRCAAPVPPPRLSRCFSPAGPGRRRPTRQPAARTPSPRGWPRARGPRWPRRGAPRARPSRAIRSTRHASRGTPLGHTVARPSTAIGSWKKREGSQSSPAVKPQSRLNMRSSVSTRREMVSRSLAFISSPVTSFNMLANSSSVTENPANAQTPRTS